jgi:Ca2+-binding RTX toxin-like protein
MEEAMNRLYFKDWQPPSGITLRDSWRDQYGTPGDDTLHGDWSGAPYFASKDDIGGLRIHAGDGEDKVYAGFGDDEVWGGDKDDELYGEGGTDTLYGEQGSDWLDGGSGADTMVGGVGDDTYVVGNALDRVIEFADFSFSPTTDFSRDTIISFVDVSLPLDANVENLTLEGNALIGIGNDKDNEIISNSNWGSILDGRDGDDQIYGSDNMHGDIIVGGNGRDGLWGKGGGDLFVWSSTAETGIHSATMDSIKNFSPLEGDRIFLRGIDADETMAGHQEFSFVGQTMTGINNGGPPVGGFTAPGQIGYEHEFLSANLYIWLNTDGDAEPEAGITLRYASSFDKYNYAGSGIPDAGWFDL